MKTKTIFTGFAATVLVISLGSASFSAAEPTQNTTLTDLNQTGICSFCSSDCSFVDEDGDGVCDFYKENRSFENCRGQNYFDNNQDGICDNFTSGKCYGAGRGMGRGRNGRHRRCGR